jgi:hypothetical protein
MLRVGLLQKAKSGTNNVARGLGATRRMEIKRLLASPVETIGSENILVALLDYKD